MVPPLIVKQYLQLTETHLDSFMRTTPLKIYMEHHSEGLEDDSLLQMGAFLGSMLIFWGVRSSIKKNVKGI